MKRIRAFTIVELLVGMIISSIVLSISWNVVFFFNRYRMQIEEKANYLHAIGQYERLITADFSNCVAYQLTASGIEMYGFDTIVYRSDSTLFIRDRKDQVDTLGESHAVQFQIVFDHTLQTCLMDKQYLPYCFRVTQMNSSESSINLTE